MKCPECGYDNPEGRRYCEECGEKIARLEAEKARARRRAQREAARLRREAEKRGLPREEAERRRRRARRKAPRWVGILLLLAVVGAAVAVTVLLIAGGESGPEKAVKEFFEAIRDKDVISYLRHTDLDLYKMAQRGEYEPDPYSEGLEYDFYVLRDLKTELVKEEGDYAEVKVVGGYFEGRYEDGRSSGGVDFSVYPRTIALVKVEDQWLVVDYNLVKLPYPLPEIVEEEPGSSDVDAGV